jgi:prepilin signal peptidase PulO-like enzyme (type II secretory pathway)
MMGGGDVKLAFLIGLALGPIKTLVALVLAFNSAAVVGLTLIMMGRKSRKDAIPFGPFLVMGFLTGILFGDELIRSYESLLLLP